MRQDYKLRVMTHLLIYLLEILFVSGVLTALMEQWQPSETLYETFEKFFLSYAAYQLVVFIVLNTLDDIKKDSTLMLRNLLKLCILYKETGNLQLKKIILDKIDEQFSENALNDDRVERLLKDVREHIDDIDPVYLQAELLGRENDYEYYQLQWRLSFILRICK